MSSPKLAPYFVVVNEKRRPYTRVLPFGHSENHVNCPACLSARKEYMSKQNLSLATLPFSEAAPIWFETRRQYLRPRTLETNQCFVNALTTFFKETVVRDIHIGSIMEYQKWRKQQVGASTVNHEVSVLAQILARANLWTKLKAHYDPLPLPKWQPRKVLTPDEEDKMFELASKSERTKLAYWVLSLTNNTTAGTGELRLLQFKHVYLDSNPPKIHIPDAAAKNEYRARVIPLNETALKQMQRVTVRANKLGSHKPEHYIFPFREKKNSYNPDRPASASFIRNGVRDIKFLGDLDRLTPHMMRHQAITKLLENGAPEHTVKAIAGHVSDEMLEHYSHARIHAKAEALNGLQRKARNAG